jgi:DNA-binding XRE family transcriptional regulator
MEAERIKEIRQKLGITQQGLGEKIGVSKISVYKWENNRCHPHPTFAEKIEALDNGQQ